MATTRRTANRKATQPVKGPNPGATVEDLTPQITITLNHEQIAQRAFAIWQAKGRPHGQDEQNWTEAETQLHDELARRA